MSNSGFTRLTVNVVHRWTAAVSGSAVSNGGGQCRPTLDRPDNFDFIIDLETCSSGCDLAFLSVEASRDEGGVRADTVGLGVTVGASRGH